MRRSAPRGDGSQDLQRGVGLIIAIGGAVVFVINLVRGVTAYSLAPAALLAVPEVGTVGLIAVIAAFSAYRSGAFWRWSQVVVFFAAGLISALDSVPGSLTGYMLVLFGVFVAFEYDFVARRPDLFIITLTVIYIVAMATGMRFLGDFATVNIFANIAGVVIMALLGWFLLASRIRRLRGRERELRAAVDEQTAELRRRFDESERLRESLQASLRGQRELLAEIHHRTKNNLQLVSALIGFDEQELAGSPSDRPARIARTRIKALAVLHDRIYASLSAARVDLARLFGEYVEQLASLVAGELRFESSVRGAALGGVDHTIRTCLAMNEIVLGLVDAHRDSSPPASIRVDVCLEHADTVEIAIASAVGVDALSSRGREGFELAGQILARIGGALERSVEGKWVLRAPVHDEPLPPVL